MTAAVQARDDGSWDESSGSGDGDKGTIWKWYQGEIGHQFDVFGKRKGGLKNTSGVLDNGGDGKALNVDQKPRESQYKHAEFIPSTHV